jgi:hypothetical protein
VRWVLEISFLCLAIVFAAGLLFTRIRLAIVERLQGWIGSRRAAVILLGGSAGVLLFLSMFAVAMDLKPWADKRREKVILLLERGSPGMTEKAKERDRNFQDIHRHAFEQLIQEINQGMGLEFRLRLASKEDVETVLEKNLRYKEALSNLDTTKVASVQKEAWKKFIDARYVALREMPNLLLMFDNCWGMDILNRRAAIREFPVPIVFLNADHNLEIQPEPDGKDYGDARFFVGSSDRVPSEVCAILPVLQKYEKVPKDSLILFVTESDYKLTERFDKLFAELKERAPTLPEIKKRLLTGSPENRLQMAAARTDIVKQFLGDSWKDMQKMQKLLVLNSHESWGAALIPWLDDTFDNLTIIAYQSSILRTETFTFGRKDSGNRLVLLSTSAQNINRELQLRIDALRKEFPKDYDRFDAPFFVRRCVIGMDLCREVLANRSWSNITDQIHFQRQFSGAWKRFRGSGASGSLGRYRFSEKGELKGQNTFELFVDGELSAFEYQLAFAESKESMEPPALAKEKEPAKEKSEPMRAIRASYIGISDIEIRNIDVANGTMRAEFNYQERTPFMDPTKEAHSSNASGEEAAAAPQETDDELKKQQTRPRLRPLNFEPPQTGGDPEQGENGQRIVANDPDNKTVSDRTFHVSGTFNVPLSARYYPFDRHYLDIELQAEKPDHEMRLTRAVRSNGLAGREIPRIDGWTVLNSYITRSSRDTNPTLQTADSQRDQRSNYDTILVRIAVKRGGVKVFL